MVTVAITSTAVFPKSAVLAALTDELIEVARSEAPVRGILLPADRPGLLAAPVPMDSLTTVDALCVLDAVVGFKLKENLVRTGGYASVAEAINHLMPRIEKAWDKRKAGSK